MNLVPLVVLLCVAFRCVALCDVAVRCDVAAQCVFPAFCRPPGEDPRRATFYTVISLALSRCCIPFAFRETVTLGGA